MATKKVIKKYQDGGVKKDSTSTLDKAKVTEQIKELKRMLDEEMNSIKSKRYEIKKYSPPIKKKGGTTKSKK